MDAVGTIGGTAITRFRTTGKENEAGSDAGIGDVETGQQGRTRQHSRLADELTGDLWDTPPPPLSFISWICSRHKQGTGVAEEGEAARMLEHCPI